MIIGLTVIDIKRIHDVYLTHEQNYNAIELKQSHVIRDISGSAQKSCQSDTWIF